MLFHELEGILVKKHSDTEAEYREICQRLSGRCEDIRDFISSIDKQITTKNNIKAMMTGRSCVDDARVRKMNDIYEKDIERLYRENINTLLGFEEALDKSIEVSRLLCESGHSVDFRVRISVADQLLAPVDKNRIKNLLDRYGYELIREILLETWKLSSLPREQGIDPLQDILRRLHKMKNELSKDTH